jgi:hypothetical protein
MDRDADNPQEEALSEARPVSTVDQARKLRRYGSISDRLPPFPQPEKILGQPQ